MPAEACFTLVLGLQSGDLRLVGLLCRAGFCLPLRSAAPWLRSLAPWNLTPSCLVPAALRSPSGARQWVLPAEICPPA